MSRVGLYARVSTLNHHQDPEVQLRDMRAFVGVKPGWEIKREFVDKGVSGTKLQRTELDKLYEAVRKGELDVVVVWKFDRFARSTIHLAQALEFFKAHNVAFVSMTEDVNTGTPAGKMIFTILGALAEMERDLIAERVRAGLRLAESKGHKSGRPVTEVTAEQVASLVRETGSVQRAAWRLNISRGTAHGLLRRARRAS